MGLEEMEEECRKKDWSEKSQMLSEKIGNITKLLVEGVAEWGGKIKEKTKEIQEKAIEEALPVLQSASKKAIEVGNKVIQDVAEIANAVKETAKEKAVEKFKEAVPQLKAIAKDAVEQVDRANSVVKAFESGGRKSKKQCEV